MDTKKVITTLFVLVIIFSLLSITLNLLYGGKTIEVVSKPKSVDKAQVGLFIEGRETGVAVTGNSISNVGLYVE
ncbi:MAG: hypothetical protein N3D20_01600 [Candidatus Pacearchaeota archaeon]|nr:hypothetical protein [Candidatus Pacearchaeota archaeon]